MGVRVVNGVLRPDNLVKQMLQSGAFIDVHFEFDLKLLQFCVLDISSDPDELVFLLANHQFQVPYLLLQVLDEMVVYPLLGVK